jgi:hypothetical protein
MTRRKSLHSFLVALTAFALGGAARAEDAKEVELEVRGMT